MADTWQPVPLPDGAYKDDSRPFTAQDVVGYAYVGAEAQGTRSPAVLRSLPGMREFVTIANTERQRGARNVEGKLFVVVDTSLYQISPQGGLSLLGEIPGHGRVSMSHNQITNGNQLIIVTGTLGYIYNTVDLTLTQITDTGFPGAIVADFIAQLFVEVEPQRRYFFNSDLVDGLSYNALETYQGESKPDRIVSLIVANGEVVLLNERSLDHFAYTGTTNALFQNKLVAIDRGCAATYAVSLMDNAVYFIGDDGSGYEKRGYNLRRITTHAIEQAWSRCKLSQAFSFTWEDRGHKVWYVTFPDGETWGYDVSSGKWHRRQSYGMNRWRLAWLVEWRGDWYGGEYNSGRIFKLDWDYFLEGCDPLVREFTTGVLHADGNRLSLNGVRIEFDSPGPDSVCVDVPPQTAIEITGDLPDQNLGATVDYTYTVTGNVGAFAVTILSGSLPDGLTMDSTGHITGTTTLNGLFSWTVKVTDSIGQTDTLPDTCLVTSIGQLMVSRADAATPRFTVCTQFPLAIDHATTEVGTYIASLTNALNDAGTKIYGQDDGDGSSGAYDIGGDAYTAFTDSVQDGGICLVPGTDFGYGCGNNSPNVYKYKISTGELLATLTAPADIRGQQMGIKADGTYLYMAAQIAAAGPKYIRLKVADDSMTLHPLGGSPSYSGASFQAGCTLNNDETVLYLGGSFVRAARLVDDMQLWESHTAHNPVNGVELSPDGSVLVGLADNIAQAHAYGFDAANGDLVADLTLALSPCAATYSRNGAKVYISCYVDGRVYAVDVATWGIDNFVNISGAHKSVIVG